MGLRPYQAEAVSRVMDAVRSGEHPVASLPTGSGKSVVAAAIVGELRRDGRRKIIVTVPSRELAEQNERALVRMLGPEHVGVVCTALGRREAHREIIVGTPQSLARIADFQPDAVVVDECHQMPLHKGSNFAKLFARFPSGMATQRIGLSATTFRTADGAVFGRGKRAWFTCQPYELSVGELVEMGFLAPVRYVAPGVLMTVKGVQKSVSGDYNQGQLVAANLDQVGAHVRIIMDEMETRRRAMIFAVTVDHARAYVEELARYDEPAALIVGAISPRERAAEVEAFKAGGKRVAVTVAAALTGFDVPEIDLLASCRPTMSPIIHTQSIGRGTRPIAGKADCLVLDFANNIPMFGPVHRPHFDSSGQPLGGVAPWRACPSCGTFSHFEEASCDHCGTALKVRRAVTARDLEYGTTRWFKETDALKALVAEKGGMTRLPVESIALHAYRKTSDPSQVSLMMSVGLGGEAVVRMWFKRLRSRHFAAAWTRFLGDAPVPTSIEEAYGRRDELVRPAHVDVSHDGSFWTVTAAGYEDDEEEIEMAA